jgi:hypothetical protein
MDWEGGAMAEWTIEDVAARFAEAADTGRRLPRVRVQGYFNVWPELARDAWEAYPEETPEYRPLPPSPQAIERMLETMRWVQWLEMEQRHLVWMRAQQREWKDIARRCGGCTRTSQRHWQRAVQSVTDRLNAARLMVS